jgi:dTDP-4-amino-4,6-dideoxygalactose transaminase
LDEIQAAVLSVKLKYLDQDNQHRKDVAQYYIDNIKNTYITLPDTMPMKSNAFHLFPILVGEGKRNELHDYLEMNGVGTVIHYPIPPHKQECYKEWNNFSLPITEQIAAQELSLPIGPSITMEEVKEVVKLINIFTN